MSYELISMNEQEVLVRMPIEQWQSIIESPQIKELSDEEIEQIAVKWYVGTRILPIGFARAILKKASEK